MRLSALANALPDCVLETGGDDPDVVRVAAAEDAQPQDITYCWSNKFLPALAATRASAAILDMTTRTTLPALRSEQPRLVFARVLQLLNPAPAFIAGLHPSAVVGADAVVAEDSYIGPGVVIGQRVKIASGVQLLANAVVYDDVEIARNTVVHANCVIRERSRIGANCTLYPGCVIGSDGFGFELQRDGEWCKIPQTGAVVIEDNVEIGCLTAVDRPAVGKTYIRCGAKVDNLVQIGHGCDIGKSTLLVAQVGLAGGVKTGHHVVLAGQVGVADHVMIGDGTMIGAKSGVPGDVEPGSRLMGYPVQSARDWKRMVAAERRIPDVLRELQELTRRVEALENPTSGGDTDR